MNRRLLLGLQALLFLVMLLTTGCPGGGGDPLPPGPVRNYGPPLHDVIFLDQQDYVATVASDGSTQESYLLDVGNNQDFSSPGLGVLYKTTPHGIEGYSILVYDYSTKTLNILDGEGGIYSYDNILPDYYDASESRVARIQEVEEGVYQLQRSRWESVLPLDDHGSVQAPYYYASRPSISSNTSRILISIYNANDPTVNRISIMGSNDYEHHSRTVTALAPQYCPVTDDSIAFLEAPDGPEMVTNLVIVDGELDNEHFRFDFSSFGAGATSFAWSPNGEQIALYTGIYGPDPKLVIVSLNTMSMTALDLGDYTVSLGVGDDLVWAFPEWNNDGSEIVFPARIDIDGSVKYHIVKYNFLESSLLAISDNATESTHPHWRKYLY